MTLFEIQKKIAKSFWMENVEQMTVIMLKVQINQLKLINFPLKRVT
jgi:hypothetical protein